MHGSTGTQDWKIPVRVVVVAIQAAKQLKVGCHACQADRSMDD